MSRRSAATQGNQPSSSNQIFDFANVCLPGEPKNLEDGSVVAIGPYRPSVLPKSAIKPTKMHDPRHKIIDESFQEAGSGQCSRGLNSPLTAATNNREWRSFYTWLRPRSKPKVGKQESISDTNSISQTSVLGSYSSHGGLPDGTCVEEALRSYRSIKSDNGEPALANLSLGGRKAVGGIQSVVETNAANAAITHSHDLSHSKTDESKLCSSQSDDFHLETAKEFENSKEQIQFKSRSNTANSSSFLNLSRATIPGKQSKSVDVNCSSSHSNSASAINNSDRQKSAQMSQDKFLRSVREKLAKKKGMRAPVILFTLLMFFVIQIVLTLVKIAGWESDYSLTCFLSSLAVAWLLLMYSLIIWAGNRHSPWPFYLAVIYNFWLSLTVKEAAAFVTITLFSFNSFCILLNALSGMVKLHLLMTTILSVAQFLLASVIVYLLAKNNAASPCTSVFCFGVEPASFHWGIRGVVASMIMLLALFFFLLYRYIVINSQLLVLRDEKMRELYVNAVQMKRQIRNFEQRAVLDLHTPLQKATLVLQDLVNGRYALSSGAQMAVKDVLYVLSCSENLFKPEGIEQHADFEVKGWLNDLLLKGHIGSTNFSDNEQFHHGDRRDLAKKQSARSSGLENIASNPQEVLEHARRRLSAAEHIPLPMHLSRASQATGSITTSQECALKDHARGDTDVSSSISKTKTGVNLDPISTCSTVTKQSLDAGSELSKVGDSVIMQECAASSVAKVESSLKLTATEVAPNAGCSLRFLLKLPKGTSANLCQSSNPAEEAANSQRSIMGPSTLENMDNVASERIYPCSIEEMNPAAVDFLSRYGHTIGFNTFEFNELAHQHGLYHLVSFLGSVYGVEQGIPNLVWRKVLQWTVYVEQSYSAKNSYHNSLHACDVTQAVHYFMSCKRLSSVLSIEEKFSAILAAAVHDVAHPGVNNQFLTNTVHPLAVRYNDVAVLENYHASTAFEIMANNASCDFLVDLGAETRKLIREIMLALILATDMGQHFEFVGKLKAKNSVNSWNWESKADRKLALCVAIKCADISNPVRPFPIYAKWTHAVMEEFYSQGDEEKRLGLPVSMFMNKDLAETPKCQNTFIDYLVSPLYESFCDFLGPGNHMEVLGNLESNRTYWKSKLQLPLPTSTLSQTSKSENV